jgi:hypothetical protein
MRTRGSQNERGKKMKRADLKLIETGTWVKINSAGKKTYQHNSGIVVRYDHNAWAWEIVGGKNDGYMYGTLTVAAYEVERGLQP